MPWELNFDPGGCILRVTTHGLMHVGSLKQMCSEAMAAGRERGASLYLIDHRDTTPILGTLDIHSYPQFLEDMGARKEARVALVFSLKGTNDDVTFFENVLVNRGFSFRVFNDLDSALDWLRQR